VSEERQRILREQGSRPAEAEKEESAEAGREKLGRSEAERQAEQAESPDQPMPRAEDDPSTPRPRR
jgi:hypothetical protein